MFLLLFNTELREDEKNLSELTERNGKKRVGLFIGLIFLPDRNNRTALAKEGQPPMVKLVISYKNHREYNTQFTSAP